MFWHRTSDYYLAGNGWRKEIGNVLLNQGIHLIDLIIWFFGYPKSIFSKNYRVKSNIDCFDSSIVTLTFTDRMYASMIFTTACTYSEPFQFNVYGSEGTMRYNNRRNMKSSYVRDIIFNGIKSIYYGKRHSPLYFQIEDFISSIINNKLPQVSLKEAYQALNLVKECEYTFLSGDS